MGEGAAAAAALLGEGWVAGGWSAISWTMEVSSSASVGCAGCGCVAGCD
jgi:hypothetical protein